MTFRSQIALVSMLSISACGTESGSKLDIIGGQQEPSDKLAKGSYSSTIGFSGKGLGTGSCTASRLSQNTFITGSSRPAAKK